MKGLPGNTEAGLRALTAPSPAWAASAPRGVDKPGLTPGLIDQAACQILSDSVGLGWAWESAFPTSAQAAWAADGTLWQPFALEAACLKGL